MRDYLWLPASSKYQAKNFTYVVSFNLDKDPAIYIYNITHFTDENAGFKGMKSQD